MIAISSIGRCLLCTLVILLTKKYGDTDMTCKWDVRVHLTEHDQLLSTLLSRVAHKRYGYKYPSDLRSPQWLTNNSLCFGVRLSEFLIQDWKISGHSQVLMKLVHESRWNWPLQKIGENALSFNLIRPWPGQSLWRVTGFIRLKHIIDVLLGVDKLNSKSSLHQGLEG